MISPLLAKLYGIILEKKINVWLESHGKRAMLRIIAEECQIIKPISYVVSLTLEKLLTQCLD
jgi:hypothetical protein